MKLLTPRRQPDDRDALATDARDGRHRLRAAQPLHRAAVGELPADQVAPQLWVRDDADLPRATALLTELRTPRPSADWCCFDCGERVEGQFYQCWNCGATRPDA